MSQSPLLNTCEAAELSRNRIIGSRFLTELRSELMRLPRFRFTIRRSMVLAAELVPDLPEACHPLEPKRLVQRQTGGLLGASSADDGMVPGRLRPTVPVCFGCWPASSPLSTQWPVSRRKLVRSTRVQLEVVCLLDMSEAHELQPAGRRSEKQKIRLFNKAVYTQSPLWYTDQEYIV